MEKSKLRSSLVENACWLIDFICEKKIVLIFDNDIQVAF
jgi:hypothetical protein